MPFLENFEPKIAFFRCALPFKISIYWRLYKNFSVGRPKMDVKNNTNWGNLLVGERVKFPKSAPAFS